MAKPSDPDPSLDPSPNPSPVPPGGPLEPPEPPSPLPGPAPKKNRAAAIVASPVDLEEVKRELRAAQVKIAELEDGRSTDKTKLEELTKFADGARAILGKRGLLSDLDALVEGIWKRPTASSGS